MCIKLESTPKPAFKIDTPNIIETIIQQFPDRLLCLRELGQNSVDAGASKIVVNLAYDKEKEEAKIEFEDNGCGMTREIIEKHYLTLFWSSKEGKKTIGEYSIGRLSMFSLKPRKIEILTASEQDSAYLLEINGDLSANFYKAIDSPLKKGTRVTIYYPCKKDKWKEEVKKIIKVLEKELGFIDTTLRVNAEFIEEEEKEENFPQIINRGFMDKFAIFPRLLMVNLKDTEHEALVYIGLSENNYGVRFTKGKIPLEYKSSLPWLGRDNKSFEIEYLTLYLDSFSFSHVFSRNQVLEDDFYYELISRLFSKIILPYYKEIARLVIRKEASYYYSGNNLLALALASLCIQAEKYNFEIPSEVYRAPIIPSYDGWETYSLESLKQIAIEKKEKGEKIYYTTLSPKEVSFYYRRYIQDKEDDFIILALGKLPWRFEDYLKDKLGDNILRKTDNEFVVKDTVKTNIEEDILGPNKSSSEIGYSHNNKYGIKIEELDLELKFCELEYINGTPNITERSYFYNNTIYLNLNHPYIKKLVELYQKGGNEQQIAAHYLFREALYIREARISTLMRRHLLEKDLKKRFETYRYIPFQNKEI